MNECDIFMAALEIDSPEERSAWLERSCGDDLQLRQRVEKLLASHDSAGSLLEHPAVDGAATELLADTIDRLDGTGSRTTPYAEDIPLDFLEPAQRAGSLGRLGQYDILETIGRGGMGIVLKAHDAKLNRVAAVKVLAPERASNSTARKRFEREAQAAAAVSHDHVVTIYAVETGDGNIGLPYLVMEFIDGESLQQKIDRQGALELKEILRIGRQIASGLAAAHEQGLIHRDVKPSNILLQNGVQRVQITDFGLARAVDDVGMTKTGEVTGTPQYMSPEQAQGQPVDARSDLFSLGSVLYAMCTGRSPFRADTSVASLRRVCDDTPRPIRDVAPDIPDWLVEVIDRLLEKDADDRLQSAEEVAELLGRHLAHLQDPGSTPFPGTVRPLQRRPVSRMSGRRHRWVVAGLVLFVLAASFGVTEATGVTQFTSTVFRIVTGEGTLIVEVDDPSLSVIVDRNGEVLTVSDGTHHIFTLRPGEHEVLISRDGEPVRQELVTITRGGRQVVRVSREADPRAIGVESRHAETQDGLAATAMVSRARRLAASGNLDEAEADFNTAVDLAPNEPDVHYARAEFWLEQGEVERAALDFNAALDAYPEEDRWADGQRVYLAAVGNDAVYEFLLQYRDDGDLRFHRMIHHLCRDELNEAGEIAQYQLAPGRYRETGRPPTMFMAGLLLCGHEDEFERWRDIVHRNEFEDSSHADNYYKVLSLGLAPTPDEKINALLDAARSVEAAPWGTWYNSALGLVQLRAGKLDEALAILVESGADRDSVAVSSPLLAIVHHHKGNRENAESYLDQTEQLLEQCRRDFESGNYDAISVPAFNTHQWILSMVFYQEAKTLIEDHQE